MLHQQVLHSLTCDDCGKRFKTSVGKTLFRTPKEAEAHAIMYGWAVYGQNCYCPQCKESLIKEIQPI